MIGYARVSTRDQNPDLQLDALRAAGCKKVFIEQASGTSLRRPELKAAIAELRPGDALVVWRLDRLGRSLLQVIGTISELDAKGVGFVSLTESLDTTNNAGRLVLHIFGAVAEFERSIIVERTLAGLAAARARGRIGGRPRKLGEAELSVARALLSETTMSVAEIAKRVGVSPSTLYSYLPLPRGVHQRN